MKQSVFRTPLFLILTLVVALSLTRCSSDNARIIVVQAPLPYDEAALAPYISAETLSVHYGKHHAAYVKKANDLIRESGLTVKTHETLLRQISGKTKHQALFDQAAQAWNHAFFWNCLKPDGGGLPPEELLKRIIDDFGSFEAFKSSFIAAAQTVFGSGWVWLAQDGKRLVIQTTSNADTPLAHGLNPLFTVDVWEHAYYLDYQNKRIDFVTTVINHLADWNYAASLLDADR